MNKKEIDNAPECEECDGNCCEDFMIYTPHDGKSWALHNFKKRMAHWYPTVVLDKCYFSKDKKHVCAICNCTLLVNGKCSDYAHRYGFCKTFPQACIADGMDKSEKRCSLVERLVKEMEEAKCANGETQQTYM